MSVLRDRGLLRERRDCPSTTSMDDWYLEVCKRNVHKLSVVGMPQPRVYRPRSGSFKDTVKIVTGKWNAPALFLQRSHRLQSQGIE